MEDRSPQLLDLIPKDREWLTKSSEETIHGVSEEKEIELTLGPPGGEWRINSLSYFRTSPCLQNPVLTTPSPWQHHQAHKVHSSYLHLERQMSVTKESSQPCSNSNIAAAVQSSGSAQKRTASTQVVGWPPIRSFRKNITSFNSSKQETESPNVSPTKIPTRRSTKNCSKTPFVKINMDGIPIGRKVDLNAYNSYEELSLAVDQLFKGLLAEGEEKGGKFFEDLLDGSGKYTLVYEDNEGDKMLVGDVPWQMFVSTVKRLRVLRSSELPSLSRGSKQGKPHT